MIIGNLNHLSLAGLPAWVRNILLRPECIGVIHQRGRSLAT